MTGEPDGGLVALAERIADRSGLDMAAYKDRCLRRRIASRMRACGVHNYTDYVAVLDRQPEELDRLLDAITINVTRFFRNPETWTWLETNLLPGLLGSREGRLRMWSAGSASGEEAYTLVMLAAAALERLGHPDWLDRLQVDATDIDRQCLERARAACYEPRAFSEAPVGVMERYTRPGPGGTVQIREDVRRLVTVSRLDLTAELPGCAGYDLICCRNVVIYFDRRTQERLMHCFADALGPGGILVLGKVETILGPARSRFELVEARERIYRKAA